DAAFFRVSAADMLSKWVGEAEQNIRKLFDAARGSPRSIVFIDEIDSLLPARRDDGGAGVMQRVVPQILQEIDGFERAKTAILFMKAMAGDEAVITPDILAQVMNELRPSVTPDQLRKFDEWAK